LFGKQLAQVIKIAPFNFLSLLAKAFLLSCNPTFSLYLCLLQPVKELLLIFTPHHHTEFIERVVKQGDQTGRIFACWVIFFLRAVFLRNSKFPKFFRGKSYVLCTFGEKWVGLHFGQTHLVTLMV
jgi:hypothetical protein